MKKRTRIMSLTVKEQSVARKILSGVVVEDFFTGSAGETVGLWDSGATNSVVTRSFAQNLGLTLMGQTQVRGVHGVRTVNVYYVKIRLKGTDIQLITNVTESEELSKDRSVGMLLGMNVITKGDFSITNYRGKTTMSFRVPSKCVVDYTKK